jgi:hypothetical protein
VCAGLLAFVPPVVMDAFLLEFDAVNYRLQSAVKHSGLFAWLQV